LRQAGKPGKRFGRYKLRFAPELHAADHGRQVHVAAALAGSQKRALNLHCAGKNGGPGVGDSKAAIGVAVKSESCLGVIARQAADRLATSSGLAPPVVSQTTSRLTFLADALRRHLVEVVQAALAEIGSQSSPFSRRPQQASMACSRSTITSRPLSCRQAMVS
jgi:hypothetical protein